MEFLIGKLNFAASVVPARPFLRRLIELIHPNLKPHHFIRLTQEAKEDLAIWEIFLKQYNGKTFFRTLHMTSTTLHMASDSSHIGFGACFTSHWIQSQFPQSWSKYHITFLEMYPVFVIISMFGKRITNSHVLFLTDNSAVKDIINSQTSKNKDVMKIVRPLILTLIKYNIQLTSQHIPGSSNILPDAISRFQVTQEMLNSRGMDPQPTPVPQHLLPENFEEWYTMMSSVPYLTMH